MNYDINTSVRKKKKKRSCDFASTNRVIGGSAYNWNNQRTSASQMLFLSSWNSWAKVGHRNDLVEWPHRSLSHDSVPEYHSSSSDLRTLKRSSFFILKKEAWWLPRMRQHPFALILCAGFPGSDNFVLLGFTWDRNGALFQNVFCDVPGMKLWLIWLSWDQFLVLLNKPIREFPQRGGPLSIIFCHYNATELSSWCDCRARFMMHCACLLGDRTWSLFMTKYGKS